jgi:hypothetical protein
MSWVGNFSNEFVATMPNSYARAMPAPGEKLQPHVLIEQKIILQKTQDQAHGKV